MLGLVAIVLKLFYVKQTLPLEALSHEMSLAPIPAAPAPAIVAAVAMVNVAVVMATNQKTIESGGILKTIFPHHYSEKGDGDA